MKQSLMYKLCLLLFVIIGNGAFAQEHFMYKADVDSVVQNGFFNIVLSPALIAKCKAELEDLRIKDDAGKESAYILYTEPAQPNEESFTEFPISYSEDRKAVFINNILPNSLDKIFLLIKNSEAQRTATLSGSDDQVHWFAVKENFILQREYAADGDAFVQSVSFPPSNYKYFRITMSGKNVLPLNISKAGIYRHSFTNNTYDSIPSPQVIQKDSSNKRSYVYLSFKDSYQVDNISLIISGAKFYKRRVEVYNKNTINPVLTIDSLSSVRQSDIEVHCKTNRLLIVIDNRDNEPLKIVAAAAQQLHTSLTAYLEKDKTYTLFFGDSTALSPSYDLQYFNDSIGSDILPLGIKNIQRLPAKIPASDRQNNESKWILWVLIIGVLLLLIYFSFRMIRDINKKKEDHVDL